MVFAIALAFLVRQYPIDASYNGAWVDGDGNTFVLLSPDGLWANFNGRHYTAGGIKSVDNGGYFGTFEDARNLVLESVHSDFFSQNIGVLSRGPLPEPRSPSGLGLPDVPQPETTADSGRIRILFGATNKILKLAWKTDGGQMVFDDQVYFGGTAARMNVDGNYEGSGIRLTLTESGTQANRNFTGLAVVNGTTYSLRGWRAWSRGPFRLVDRDNGDTAGEGWLEWHPTPKFARSMIDGKSGPSDQIEVWLNLANGHFRNGLSAMLARKSPG